MSNNARRPFEDPLSKLLGDREPLEVARELFVYAPIGIASRFSKDLPSLIEEGRSKYSVAKVVGTFAAKQGKRQFEDRVRNAADAFFGYSTQSAQHTTPEPEVVDETQSSVSDSAHLAIVRYDTLSATQVLAQLANLTSQQRDAIAAYESTTRNRHTILKRIEQLNNAHS